MRAHMTSTTWRRTERKSLLIFGGVSGGDIKTYDTFAGKAPDATRLYGSLGVRIGI